MTEFNFHQIRIHEGSQDGGFEELICQIAHLIQPENADYFVRKSGDGGDAGVECYWKLKDGTEHAWQAKYYLEILTPQQWTNITNSVRTALKKHPRITKYYICLPRNWNDSRKINKSGNQVDSSWDKWKKNKKKWEKIAGKEGMNVEFIPWTSHDISLFLNRDIPEFAGRAHYWFNSSILTQDSFAQCVEKSKYSLGERYSPEFHLTLPVWRVFDPLGNTEEWRDLWHDEVESFIKNLKRTERILKGIKYTGLVSQISSLCVSSERILDLLNKRLIGKTFFNHIDDQIEETNKFSIKLDEVYEFFLNKPESEEEKWKKLRDSLWDRVLETENFAIFLKSQNCKIAKNRAVLLVGEAGMGKSYLLCDIAVNRISKRLPTLFLLGQHYQGKNPITSLKSIMDLEGIRNGEFLASLDAAGEASGTNTLIIVDAINEGKNRDDWEDYLGGFLKDILKFPHISVVVSCRSTYVEYLVNKEFVDNPLINISHPGFRGHEHRAAEVYLNRQGISKPSTPVSAPEFSNPLFLKTCCSALKERGMTAFPKGGNGISKLFEFYVESMEIIVGRKKRYRSGELIVKKSLNSFAGKLFKNNLFGLPIGEARNHINSFDPKIGKGDDLFDILIQEGVLSEDWEFSRKQKKRLPVVRFTYERFSDFFIATKIAEDWEPESLATQFLENKFLKKIVENNSYGAYAGILQALGIIIPERFARELPDILPENKRLFGNGLINKIFTAGLQWRSPSSFSSKTLKWVEQIPINGYFNPAIDLLLKIATEPDHPWNADYLHEKLQNMAMPERDRYWNTHISINDQEEDEYYEQSIVRTLINWPYSGDLTHTEEKRIRLCTIILLWMTSASNKKIRDQSTKSAIILMVHRPDLLEDVFRSFEDVDDPYILERLYAIIYGTLTNIKKVEIVRSLARLIWKKIFSTGSPFPNILLRDYARGIMEFATHLEVLDEDIPLSSFRPPYQSKWPLSDPEIAMTDSLVGNDRSAIKSSIMGFPGDFGNYTMGCIHKWSPTSLKSPRPQTFFELLKEFSTKLDGKLKDRFLEYLENKLAEEKRFSEFEISEEYINIRRKIKEERLKKLEARKEKNKESLGLIDRLDFEDEHSIYEDQKSQREAEQRLIDNLKEEINKSLSSSDQEQFRWLMGFRFLDSFAAFSRKKAQRWIYWRAVNLGWSKELFEDYEKSQIDYLGRSLPAFERIGKKYQWIALHEFIAYLSDNCHYIEHTSSDSDQIQYDGPWQISKRNLDPTCWLRSNERTHKIASGKGCWWQPFNFTFYGFQLEEIQDWLWNEKVVPPFANLLQVKDPEGVDWLILRNMGVWDKKPIFDRENIPAQDAWYRINSCFVSRSQLEQIKKSVKGKRLTSPMILEPPSTGYQGFLREFPWHPNLARMIEIDEHREFPFGDNFDCIIPTTEYVWESGNSDKSIDSSISIFLPSGYLVESLKLTPDLSNFHQWKDSEEKIAFFDPSIVESGPGASLVRLATLKDWLKSNELQLVWLIGGEKQLFTEGAGKFFGRSIFSGFYYLTDNGIKGDLWFEKALPR